ncbi:uncharacterized protein LOC106941146 [Poecilia latipinna]|uniref:uncharacterized protein LOC106941146 n=1 Tax=Poecilia latipinna TaxID=48699 RepID=UPI00072DC4D4|nr:PREDICTED: uncharacterized protein LOC106941146 [Poecilia latipinna]
MAPLSLLVVFGLLILSTEGRGVQEELSPDFTAGSFLRGKDEHLERSRLIPDQLLHNEKVLDASLVGSDQQTMADRLQSAAEVSPCSTQEVLVPTRSTDPSDGNTRQENGSEPQQRLPVSRKLYNQTVCGSEPDQQNPQMDQVLYEADPVLRASRTPRTSRTSRTSRTPRTAPSPDDPLVQFDQQQIVMLADDEVVRTAAASLFHKHPAVSSLHAVRPRHRVRQVKGQAAPLSERSSLVLVGHGAREPSGEMRISGYSYQDVARIIQSSSRIGQKIQTTAVVACGAGSDRRFPQALLQTLHRAGLETELHLWETAVQVAETGDVLSQDGARWRSGDHSKKLVLTVGRTGEIRRRDDRRNCTGQEVPTNQTALLGTGLWLTPDRTLAHTGPDRTLAHTGPDSGSHRTGLWLTPDRTLTHTGPDSGSQTEAVFTVFQIIIPGCSAAISLNVTPHVLLGPLGPVLPVGPVSGGRMWFLLMEPLEDPTPSGSTSSF